MKEIVDGPKKPCQEPSAIKNPKTGDLVVSNEEIKKVTLAYCVNNFTKKKQDVVANLRNTLNELIMDVCKDEDLEIVKNDFDEVIQS